MNTDPNEICDIFPEENSAAKKVDPPTETTIFIKKNPREAIKAYQDMINRRKNRERTFWDQ